jgi:hypothetical protein
MLQGLRLREREYDVVDVLYSLFPSIPLPVRGIVLLGNPRDMMTYREANSQRTKKMKNFIFSVSHSNSFEIT